MKNRILHLAFLALTVISCKNDDQNIDDCNFSHNNSFSSMVANPEPPEHPCDYVSAEKNGELWKVHGITSYTLQGDTLNITGYNFDEQVTFKFFFTGPGSYDIAVTQRDNYYNGTAYYQTLLGGDVIMDYYDLQQTGTVQVSEYNESENLIKGTFQLVFEKRFGSSSKEEINFNNGKFSVHLPH
jgi:hypothetical protein